MRAVNTFVLISLALAVGMATIDQVVRHVLARGREVERDEVVPPLMLVAETVPSRVEVEKFDTAAGAKWVLDASAAARRIFADQGEVTSDCVWNVCPPPDGVDGRLMSAVLSRAEWELSGYRHSTRGRNKARQIAVWKLKHAEDLAA